MPPDGVLVEKPRIRACDELGDCDAQREELLDRNSNRFRKRFACVALTGLAGAAMARAATRMELAHETIALPGAPAEVVSADLDGDGHRDLVVVVVYTAWDQMGIQETSHMAGVEGLVEMMTVVPYLADRRELRFYRGVPGQGFAQAAPALELPTSVLALEPGTDGDPVVALTDDGLSALRFEPGPPTRLYFEPLIHTRPLLAHSGVFVANLGLALDLDHDGRPDLLLPTEEGAEVYLAGPGGFATAPASRLAYDDEIRGEGGESVRRYPLPEARDLDGDGLPELLLRDGRRGWNRMEVMRNLGGGRFAPAVHLRHGELVTRDEQSLPLHGKDEVVYLGDLDGDGRAEYVTQEDLADEDAGMRKEMAQAKRPPYQYRVHAMRPDFSMAPEVEHEFRADGYAFESGGDSDIQLPGGFQDVNGDGKPDLVTLTLDFSLFQALRILAAHSIDIGLDFHLYCQQAGGVFRPVEGLDLSGRFHLDLDQLKVRQLSQFSGDFDGDGRADFVQMGRGKTVTIHRGRDDCSFPSEPDAKIELAAEPRDLGLVQIRDLDGDGRSDLLIVQPEPAPETGVTPPVELELYLSGGGR